MKKIRLIISILMMFVASAALAQNIKVSGTVTDLNGSAIPGATIAIQGTANGTSTNIDGSYTISCPPQAVLVASNVGYKEMSIPVNGHNTVNFVLEDDSEYLDDVFVVAYGTQSAKKLTSSIVSVKADALKDAPNVSFDAMLSGQAAGVQVSNSSAGAGASSRILIRGVSSISAGTDPLYIVDGMPISSGVIQSTYTEANALADINPADILSIEVLKDAAATALYGSRAASGVIIITTKSGQKGDVKVSYDMNVGLTQPTRMMKMMDADTYFWYKNEAYYNAYGTHRTADGKQHIFEYMYDSNGNKINTKWNDLIYKNGFVQNHTLSVSGGTDKTSYYASANYSDNSGIIVGDSYRRVGVKANVSSKINKWLKVGISAQYTNGLTQAADASRNDGVFAAAGLPRLAMIMPPIVPAYNEDGSYYLKNGYMGSGNIAASGVLNNYPNPMAQLESFNKVGTSRVLANGFIELTPVKHLTLKTHYGIDYMTENEETYWNQFYGQGSDYNGYAMKTFNDMTNWTWTNTADYDLILGDHSVNFLIGMEANEVSYGWDYVQGEDILNSAYKGYRAGYKTYNAEGNYGSKAIISYFGRINYDYKARYILSLNYRRDGLSALGSNRKWGNFWGVSAAWRISEEPFFQPARSVVDDLKINVSYGVVGNSEIDYYDAQTYYTDSIYGGLSGLGLYNIGDQNLGWENSSKWDVGLSTRLFNRLDFSFDWYYTKTNDLVLAVPQGPSTGIGSLTSNAGSMQNTGIEFTISANIIQTKNFSWYSSFNFTTSHNKVLSLAEGVDCIYGGDLDPNSPNLTNITLPGYSIGQLYAYPTGGIDPQTGRRIFFGSNGEWTSYDPATKAWYLKDGTEFKGDLEPVRAGNTLPTWFGGWTNTFKFYGFDLNLLFQFSGGNWIMNANKATGSDNRWWNNFQEVADLCWKNPGDNAVYAKAYYGDNVSNGSAYDITDWIEKGDYLRLKSVSLGYTYNTRAKKAMLGFTSIRGYVQIQNAFVLTAFTGPDPELTSSYSTSPVLAGGYYKNTLPQARTYTLGVQLTF